MLARWVSLYCLKYNQSISLYNIKSNSFGFAHIPTQPGKHSIEINTWKITGNNFVDKLHGKFNTSGFTVSKSDLIYSGVERFDFEFKFPKIDFVCR